jgi:hypothetical protein
LQEESSERARRDFITRGHRHNQNICDDREDADTEIDCDKCFISEEFRKDREPWQRCASCGTWAHAECSGWEFRDGYFCDLCLRRKNQNEVSEGTLPSCFVTNCIQKNVDVYIFCKLSYMHVTCY